MRRLLVARSEKSKSDPEGRMEWRQVAGKARRGGLERGV